MMFGKSSSKISPTCRKTKTKARFTAQSHKQLKDAAEKCLELSRVGDCASGIHGSIRDWDVSAVIHMGNMFFRATAFNHKLCGDAWVNSKADKSEMFTGSPGSISSTECKTTKRGYGGDYD